MRGHKGGMIKPFDSNPSRPVSELHTRRAALASRLPFVLAAVAVAVSAAAPARAAQIPSVAASRNPDIASSPDPRARSSQGASAADAAGPASPADQNLLTPAKPEAAPASPWANRGRWTLGVQIGYALENAFPKNISHINLLIAQPQLGFIIWDSPRRRPLVDRFEILSEGILGNAIHPGGRVTGETLLFRLDGPPRRRVVPFLDLGAGVLNTTLHLRAPELNGRVQFTPQAGLGVQYFFNPQRALVLEYRYMHMSNADLVPPNLGFNSSMITIGFRWLRRPARSAAFQVSSRPSRNPLRVLFGSN